MPLWESQTVKVSLTVAVDGHTLTFEETLKAAGNRLHGESPRAKCLDPRDPILESTLRGSVDTCIQRAATQAMQFLERAYPIYSDKAGDAT